MVASTNSRFLDCERASAVADDLSSLGMTGFLVGLRACTRAGVAAFPLAALPNAQRDTSVESQLSQSARRMGQPRFVVASADSSPSDEPSPGAEARFLFEGVTRR